MKDEEKTKGTLIEELKVLRIEVDKLKLLEDEYKVLEESLRFSDAAFKSLKDSVIATDVSHVITHWNEVSEKMYGIRAEEAIGKSLFDIIEIVEIKKGETRERFRKLETEGYYEAESLNRTKNAEVWVNVRAHPVVKNGEHYGYVALATDVTERKRAQERVLSYQNKLRALALQLSLAEEKERRRIAGEIHDSVTQTLAICSVKLAEILNGKISAALVKPLSEVHTYVKKLVEETRSLTFEISSPLLYDCGLEAAIKKLSEQIREQYGITIHFKGEELNDTLDNVIRVLLFQSTRELLVNCAKHSKADNVWVNINFSDTEITIIVEDDGIGFDPSELKLDKGRDKGFGLFNVRERIRDIGGYFSFDTRYGRGSRFIINVPVDKVNV